MAKGFGGMPGNIQQMMKQAQKMQSDLQQAQERAKELTAEATAGGGMVTAVANGENQIVSLVIEKDVVDPADVEMLQDLVLAACNEALKKAGSKVQSEIAKITGGIGLPGMNIPGL